MKKKSSTVHHVKASRSKSERAIIRALRTASSNGFEYGRRPYQITVAHESAEAIASRQHTILTLPTGTGKTLIAGMVACLHLQERPKDIVLVTAPRQVLLSQLAERTRWLSGSFPVTSLGIRPNTRYGDVLPVFSHAKVIFAMPEFLTGRIKHTPISSDILSRVSLLIIDEFDAFLTFRYRVNDVTADLHHALSGLLDLLPAKCRIMMMSATTPPASVTDNADPKQDTGMLRDASLSAAYRRFLDRRFDPKYISIAERYYANYVPHAEIVRFEVKDDEVTCFDRAISEEIGVLLNWASGSVRFQLSPSYVLPRLSGIISGDLPLWPHGRRISRGGSSQLRGILSRLLLVSHCGDFLFEDMFRDFNAENQETSVYVENYTRRITVPKLRLVLPDRNEKMVAGRIEQRIEAHPLLKAKAAAVCNIVAANGAKRGVLFFRYTRLLDVFFKQLTGQGIRCRAVHGERSTEQNDLALRDFRSGKAQLLLITRDTGKRGLDLPEADYAVFYSPKSRDDVTWQEVNRIRSTTTNKKDTYILNYVNTAESEKADRMFALFTQQPRSIVVRRQGCG